MRNFVGKMPIFGDSFRGVSFVYRVVFIFAQQKYFITHYFSILSSGGSHHVPVPVLSVSQEDPGEAQCQPSKSLKGFDKYLSECTLYTVEGCGVLGEGTWEEVKSSYLSWYEYLHQTCQLHN